MRRFLSVFHPAVLFDLCRAIGQWIWHKRDCDLLVDSAWPCSCGRST